MKCPSCGLYHPNQYERCVSCGASFKEGGSADFDDEGANDRAAAVNTMERPHERASSDPDELAYEEAKHPHQRRSKKLGVSMQSRLPTMVGALTAVTVLLVSAGATIFFLTKTPDDERLFVKGKKELANGQYAFAVSTLEQAAALRNKDPRVFLALARAYVGVDQVEKAHDAISQAQQLGSGVVEEPQLASDLANYYRQRGKYEKALDLLRPLAKSNIPGKKAELADLDAMYGDEALRTGKLDLALRCWEEVRDLREGSRFSESEARLATIYQKMASNFASKNDDQKALNYLSKLNAIAQNAKNYEMASDLYEKNEKLDLAIDQMRLAIKYSTHNPVYERKLAALLTRRGKELLDAGDTDAGYGYLQQAKTVDPTNALPSVTLRGVNVGLEGGLPKISGEIWNPGDEPVNSLTVKVELVDTVSKRVLWTRDQKVVDEFVQPLQGRDSKNIDFVAGTSVRMNGTNEFKVYLDGKLYKSYRLGEKSKPDPLATDDNDSGGALSRVRPKPEPREAPSPAPATSLPQVSPEPVEQPSRPKESAEDKTMKDLE
ncbi:MAG: tetratricopeptide repeat protein [Candidatus Obscuribacterales bacterium]|nr:tetratricopeptide repeat protein [Candidatus Obscuribacterales bacterium]